jgi:hypothetical protein
MFLRLLLLLILLLVGRADATTYWGSTFDMCWPPTSADTNYFAAVVGAPTLTTQVEATTGNRCALRFTPASGSPQYVQTAPFTSTTSIRMSCRITPRSAGAGGCQREVASFIGAGGDFSGKSAILAMRNAGSSGVILKAYYGSLDQKTCSGSPDLGKQCTTVAECSELRTNEAQCAVTALGLTPIMNVGTTYEFLLTQDNTTGTATVALYQGAAGLASEVFSRGSTARIAGECSGGANDLEPCNTGSECPGGSCSTTNVPNITAIRLGSSDSTTCAPQFDIDDCWVYNGTIRENVRLETLYPDVSPTVDTNWDGLPAGTAYGCADDADAYKCVKDSIGATPDGNNSAIYNDNGTKPTVAFNFAALSTPTPLGTPVALGIEYVAQDAASGGSAAAEVLTLAIDDHSVPGPTPTPGGEEFNFEDFAGNGGNLETYYQAPSRYKETASNGSALDLTSIQALGVDFNKVDGGGNEGRITTTAAFVVSQTANPTASTKIPDRDGDTFKTMCLVGDSTWDNEDFQLGVVANTPEPDNIYFFTRGGSMLGDTAAEWAQLVEGTAGTYMGLSVRRGSAGRTCDVVFISHVVNTVYNNLAMSDPRLPVSWKGVGQAGYCEDQGGTDQGKPCHCPIAHPRTSQEAAPAPNVTPAAWGCINSGQFLATPVFFLGNFYCQCTNDAGCTYGMRTPVPLHTPAVCNTANPLFKYCVESESGDTNVDTTPLTRTSFATTGCNDSPGCVGGRCVQRVSHAQVEDTVGEITAATAALQASPPILVWVSAPHLILLDNLDSPIAFDQLVPAFDAVRRVYRRQPYFVDLQAYFRQRFPEHTCASSNNCTAEEDGNLALRDGVHWTTAGQFAAAQAIADCLTVGESDGVCTGNVCTAGLVGDACTDPEDCDIQSCDFTQ